MEKEQIKQEINKLQNKINIYESELKKYKDSQIYAERLVDNLKDAKNVLESSQKNLKKGFSIDGKTIDNGKIKSTIDDVNDLRDYIKDNIIPSIKNNINDLKKDIRNAENKIDKLWDKYYSS